MPSVLQPSNNYPRSYPLLFSEFLDIKRSSTKRRYKLFPIDGRRQKVGCPSIGFGIAGRNPAVSGPVSAYVNENVLFTVQQDMGRLVEETEP